MKVVILAGGRGTRLRPYTTNFPKPLMPVGERPILEIVIRSLRDAGLDDIILTTGYQEGLIRAFFGDGQEFGVRLNYSNERTPLGTAGPLSLIRDELDETFLVMNGDVLSDVDFTVLREFHRSGGAEATIVVAKRQVNIDFGVVELDDQGGFASWSEKPVIDYLVSAGIYVFEPSALEMLPREGAFDLPDLVQTLHARERRLSVYVHPGYWLDIGRPDDYERACEDYAEPSSRTR